MKTELLLLAAGKSQRFNGIKQLANVKGRPMVCHCLDQYRQNNNWLPGLTNGYVVLGANATAIGQVLPDFVSKVIVDNWADGMGCSISNAMDNLSKDTTHVLISLADQVALCSDHIVQLLKRSQQYPGQVVAAHYLNKLGAPAIFPRSYFKYLLRLTGDQGARSLLNQDIQNIEKVILSSASIDIDTQSDLRNYL